MQARVGSLAKRPEVGDSPYGGLHLRAITWNSTTNHSVNMSHHPRRDICLAAVGTYT
jgi:hypothetical protein